MKLSNLKKILVSTVAFVAVLTLSSCSSDLYVNHKATGGITVAQAEAKLRSLPHITSAAYNMESWDDNGEGGLGATSGMNIIVNITVDPAYHISDPTAFLSFVSKTIWAANDKYPKGSVLLEVNGGLSPNYDWSDAYKTVLGIKYDRFDSQNEDALWEGKFPSIPTASTAFVLDDSVFSKAFGKWPYKSEITVPEGIIVPGAPVEIVLPALLSPKVQKDSTSNPECYIVTITRNFSGTGNNEVYYGGAVTVTFTVGGTALKTKSLTAIASDESRNEADSEQALKWCSASFPAGPAVVTVSAQPDTIFAGVTERSGLL
jgi:hypothetical protein